MLGFAITGPKFDVGQVSSEQEGEGYVRSNPSLTLLMQPQAIVPVVPILLPDSHGKSSHLSLPIHTKSILYATLQANPIAYGAHRQHLLDRRSGVSRVVLVFPPIRGWLPE